MKQSALYNEFCDCNPQFQDKISSLSDQYKPKVLKKLFSATSRIQFLSIISEIHFIHFLSQQGFDFDYEPTINNKTPDLIIRLNEIEIVGDIKRFNLSEEDQIKERFFYELATQLKEINRPYYVRIRQIEQYSFELLNPIQIRKEFETWLSNNSVEVGDIFNYKNLFTIEITNLNGIKEYILFTYSTIENKIHPSKISSIVDDKIKYYQDTIIDKGFSFFVCIDLVFDSMLDAEDFRTKFIGSNSINIDTAIESFMLGDFYTNILYEKLLGILIRYNGNFHWIRNYRTPNLLNFNLA